MTSGMLRIAIHRRQLLIGGAAGLAALSFPALAEGPSSSDRSAAFNNAFRDIVGNGFPEDGKITLELPVHAENGNIVPYTLSVDSPMTPQSNIKTLHLLSTANPHPKVGTFHFTPQSGMAQVSGRMRLAKTQDVVCVAETNDGKLLMGVTRVEVEIGGCQT